MERWFLQRDTWEEPVKLPRISYFKASRKETSPYDRLYRWLLNKLFPMSPLLYGNEQERSEYLRANGFTVSSVWLHHEDYEKLKGLVSQWIVKYHKVSSKKRLASTLAFYDLGNGPAMFRADDDYTLPEWVKPGYVYVKRMKNGKEL